MKGVFTLQSPKDLLAKLKSDYDALRSDPNNPHLAYNFFVTAEHMLDWIYPGYGNKENRQVERDSSILLQICSHLATGAKHFVVEAKHHDSVKSSSRRRRWNPFAGPLGGPFVIRNVHYGLRVELDGEAETLLGASITVSKLAKEVLDFWSNHRGLAAGA